MMSPRTASEPPTVCLGNNMKKIKYAKQKAITRVLDKIAETGSPTTYQIIFLQMFLISKEKK